MCIVLLVQHLIADFACMGLVCDVANLIMHDCNAIWDVAKIELLPHGSGLLTPRNATQTWCMVSSNLNHI